MQTTAHPISARLLAVLFVPLVASISPALAIEIPRDDNPNINYSINPNVTYDYNPDVTYAINPNVTYSINPQVNYEYDPEVTRSINPDVTPSINPAESECSGFHVYDTSGEHIGLSVIASPDVMVYFLGSTWIGQFVSNGHKGYNLFDREGGWSGYLIPTPSGGFNLHDLDGEWIAHLSLSDEGAPDHVRIREVPRTAPRDDETTYPALGTGHRIESNTGGAREVLGKRVTTERPVCPL